jgi:hypothetical protein
MRFRAPQSSCLVCLAYAISLLAPVLLVVGCPGSLAPGFPPTRSDTGADGGTEGGPCNAPATVLTPSCGGSQPNGTANVCHGALSPFGAFALNPDLLFSSDPIVRNATFGDANCRGMPIINNSLPPDGVLFRRLETDACGPGTRMPFGGDRLKEAQINCLKEWVTANLGSPALD